MAGVELLRHHSSSSPTNILRRKSSPFVATLLSFVPGLGAAYNGQTSKAIVHFAIFASFFQMAVVTRHALLRAGRDRNVVVFRSRCLPDSTVNEVRT